MITVGHISTNSHIEKGISIFIVLVLSGIFAYSINTIGVILQELNKNDQEIRLIFQKYFYIISCFTIN